MFQFKFQLCALNTQLALFVFFLINTSQWECDIVQSFVYIQFGFYSCSQQFLCTQQVFLRPLAQRGAWSYSCYVTRASCQCLSCLFWRSSHIFWASSSVWDSSYNSIPLASQCYPNPGPKPFFFRAVLSFLPSISDNPHQHRQVGVGVTWTSRSLSGWLCSYRSPPWLLLALQPSSSVPQICISEHGFSLTPAGGDWWLLAGWNG